jgi:NADH dehydrogenase [ubiquinone] 1 alpha subcomplex assembly factor 6
MATIPGSVKQVRPKTPVPARRSVGAERLSPVAALVRRYDPDRFQTALFAPAARREALFALYAFNFEIARVRDSITQPTLGQIRLQWWRENIADAFGGGTVRHHPLVEPLTAIIREHALTRAYFDRLIDARETDLDDTAPADLAILEDYAEGTSASLVYLALEVLGPRNPEYCVAGYHVGIAYAVAGLLRAMPFWARGGRRFIPGDLAERCGIAERDYLQARSTAGLRAATAELAAAASRHLDQAHPPGGKLPRSALPALLPARIAQNWLARLKRANFDALDPDLAVSDPLQTWRLAIAAFLNRF